MKKQIKSRYEMYKFDSEFEEKLVAGVMKSFSYHSMTLDYVKPETNHRYTPDWVISKDDGALVLIEAKGRFRSREEMDKYKNIRDSIALWEKPGELVFLFQKPSLYVFGAKARKDGSKCSHAEWAQKQGFRWFTEQTILNLLETL